MKVISKSSDNLVRVCPGMYNVCISQFRNDLGLSIACIGTSMAEDIQLCMCRTVLKDFANSVTVFE